MDRGTFIFPVQLGTSWIGNLTRLIHTLDICVTIHTYIHKHIQTHTYIHEHTERDLAQTCWLPLTEVSSVPLLPSCNGPQPLTSTRVTPSVSCYHSIIGVCTSAVVVLLRLYSNCGMYCALCVCFFFFFFSLFFPRKHGRCCLSVPVPQCTTAALNTLLWLDAPITVLLQPSSSTRT